jgi:hypothetical protein
MNAPSQAPIHDCVIRGGDIVDGTGAPRYRADLAALFPKAAASVEEQFLFRAPYVEPIWTTGYSRAVPPNTVIPGRLYLACTAQVYPRVNSWNSCCAVVDQMLPRLFEEVEAVPAGGVK